jgi:hypothetical protein
MRLISISYRLSLANLWNSLDPYIMKNKLIAAILFALTASSHAQGCKDPLRLGDPGVLQCDLTGPDGSDNFLACIPRPLAGIFGPVALRSFKGLDLEIETTVADGGSSVTSRLRIVTHLNHKTLLVSGLAAETASVWVKFNGKGINVNCAP